MSTRWARNFFGRLLGLKFVRALNNYSKWRRFWTSPVQVTKNLESSRLACTGIPSTTGSPKITKRSPNVERKKKDLLCHQFQNFEALVHYVILIAQEVLLVLFFQPNQAGRNMDKKGDSKPIFDGWNTLHRLLLVLSSSKLRNHWLCLLHFRVIFVGIFRFKNWNV